MPPLYAHDPFLALHRALQSRWLDVPMAAASVACEGWVVWLVALAALSWLEEDVRGVVRAFVPLVVALALQAALVSALKGVWLTPRPLDLYGPSIVRSVLPAHGPSFPSGHAATAALLAAYAALAYGRRAAPLWLLALAVGVSRVYVGAHFVVDVAGGWALGALLGIAAYAAVLRLAPGGHLAALRAARAGRARSLT